MTPKGTTPKARRKADRHGTELHPRAREIVAACFNQHMNDDPDPTEEWQKWTR